MGVTNSSSVAWQFNSSLPDALQRKGDVRHNENVQPLFQDRSMSQSMYFEADVNPAELEGKVVAMLG